jgi:cell division protein FtsQ
MTWLPSLRSLAVALGILVVGVSMYVAARGTSVFAIRKIEVKGVPPPAAERVRQALQPLAGTSLVTFGQSDGDRRLAGVPFIASATYNRDFPHTLRVTVRAERPIALLRRGRDAWVVSATARVLSKVVRHPFPNLPRIWLPASADPLVGTVLSDESAAAVRALVPVANVRLPVPVRTVKLNDGELSLVLASGTVVLLGDAARLRLKLAVVARVIPLARGVSYIDASVPERVVTGSAAIRNPQVGG